MDDETRELYVELSDCLDKFKDVMKKIMINSHNKVTSKVDDNDDFAKAVELTPEQRENLLKIAYEESNTEYSARAPECAKVHIMSEEEKQKFLKNINDYDKEECCKSIENCSRPIQVDEKDLPSMEYANIEHSIHLDDKAKAGTISEKTKAMLSNIPETTEEYAKAPREEEGAKAIKFSEFEKKLFDYMAKVENQGGSVKATPKIDYEEPARSYS